MEKSEHVGGDEVAFEVGKVREDQRDPPPGMHLLEMPTGTLNTDKETMIENVRVNIRKGLSQVQPFPTQDRELVICGGGPSLETHFDELRDLVWNGAGLVGTNGAFQWLIDKNLRPSAGVILDAREFNKRFLEAEIPGCRYFVASQAHPSTVDMLMDRDTRMFHIVAYGDDEEAVLKDFYGDRFYVVSNGSTVTLTTIAIMRMVGFQYIHLFGFDSCFIDGKDHSYDQPENKNDKLINIHCSGRDFVCTPWMVKQAEDFMDMVHHRGDMFSLNVHGDGLIAHIMKTGAQLSDLKKEE